jgi:hypothetical protein
MKKSRRNLMLSSDRRFVDVSLSLSLPLSLPTGIDAVDSSRAPRPEAIARALEAAKLFAFFLPSSLLIEKVREPEKARAQPRPPRATFF